MFCASQMCRYTGATTQHHHTDKAVEILTNPHTLIPRSSDEERVGGGGGSKKAFNYSKQGRQTVNENVAGMQFMSMAHATKPVNTKPHS